MLAKPIINKIAEQVRQQTKWNLRI
jgi:hypothetical protein